ncbi:MAG: GNAT family N-acetyltransferase [Chitinophagales bacterium]
MYASVRPATIDDAAGIALVNFTSWNETYHGLIDNAYLDSLSIDHYERKWKRILSTQNEHSFTLLIEQDGKIVGYVSGGKAIHQLKSYEGEVYALYLLKEQHGKGYGKALFLSAVKHLQQSGFKSFCVFVLKDNPAAHFYSRFKPQFQQPAKVNIDGRDYEDIGFGWNNFDLLNA